MTSSDILSSSSLQVLKAATLEKIANRLDQTKHLMNISDDGEIPMLRDWRGLMEIASLDHDEQNKIKSSHTGNYTKEIIMIWCKKPGISIKSLLDAFARMDRFDISHDFESLILADCAYAHGQGIDLMSQVPSGSIEQALTLQDLDALAHGRPLPVYDAMVIFGDSEIDRAFGIHVVERLEDGGRKVFLQERDLVVGTMEQYASMDIIRARCQKVIPIFTPTFETSNENLFLTKYAQSLGVTGGKNIIIPVIYSAQKLENNLIKNMVYSKLPYSPDRKYNNFWKKLFGVLGVVDLPPHLEAYDFPGPNQIVSPTNIQQEQQFELQPAVGQIQPNDPSRHMAQTPTSYLTPQIPPSRGQTNAAMNSGPVIQRFNSLSSINSTSTMSTVAGTIILPDSFGETDDSQSNLIYPEPPTEEPGSSGNNHSERRSPRTSIMGKIKSKLKM